MKGALKILLELWQSEQETAGSTTADGVIHDLDRPLNPVNPGPAGADETFLQERVGSAGSDSSNGSRAAERLWQAKQFADSTSGFSKGSRQTGMRQAKQSNATAKPDSQDDVANITDRQDCRAKIFSILSCIGFECHEALNIAERQQMELVKLYPECVQLETWIKVQENLAAKGIKPISADRKWIEDSMAERRTETQWVLGVQQKLADERRSEEQASLHRFYEDIRSRAQFRRTSAKEGNGSRLASPSQEDSGYPPGSFLAGSEMN